MTESPTEEHPQPELAPSRSQPLRAAVLRPRLGPTVFRLFTNLLLLGAVMLCFDLLMTILAIEVPSDVLYDIFISTVLVIAAAFLLWLLFVHARTGIRADDEGLHDLGTGVRIRWQDIRSIQLLGEVFDLRRRQVGLRYVQILDAAGSAIRFANLGPLALRSIDSTRGRIADVEHSGLLLALIADRTRTLAIFPPQWLPTAVQWSSDSTADPSGPPMVNPVAPQVAPIGVDPSLEAVSDAPDNASVRRPSSLGQSIFKNAGKAGALLAVGFKAIKPATALVSFICYGIIFNRQWELAAMILILIGFHECGHVYAMWRCGVRVKGIYFIPFLGGAAVSQGLAKTRWGNAFIQINGPLYGTALVLLSLGMYHVVPTHKPFFAMMASWGALINLFNLLPIMPLDGGRLLGEVSQSLHGTFGRYAVIGSLILGAVGAYWADLTLLWIMVAVGMLELSRQFSAATQKALIDLLSQHRPVTYEVNEFFASAARPLSKPLSPDQHQKQRTLFDMLLTEARLIPMTRWQTALMILGYVLLATLLVLVLWGMRHVPGADHAFKVLQ